MIPAALPLTVLALAAFRAWRILAVDLILAGPRARLVGARGGVSGPLTFSRPRFEEWLSCVWCSGAWVALGVYGCWLAEPRWTLYAAVPLAISAVVGFGQSLLPE